MQSNLAEDCSYQPENIIERIRDGETQLRDYLIKTNWNNILNTVSKMIGHSASNSDEFSVALQAFNEAIDTFSPDKNMSFKNFASLVINRRVIDYIRKSSKYNKSEYPYTYFESNENSNNYIEEMYSEQAVFTEKIEIQEEIFRYKKTILEYGITFEDLVKLSPKHKDTRLMCIKIANKLAQSNELAKKLVKVKRLPVAEIANKFNISKKTVDKHRKYIIALYLAMKSDMEVIKCYINLLDKGVNK